MSHFEPYDAETVALVCRLRRELAVRDIQGAADDLIQAANAWLAAQESRGTEPGSASQPAPRFKVGDSVRWHSAEHAEVRAEERFVRQIRAEASYRLNNGETWLPESELEPFLGVCAPDGARCAWWTATHGCGTYSVDEYCSQCGGRLR